jgi:hypothetical protein
VKRNGQLRTSDQAKPAPHQHKRPCSDCPFSRKSIPGWLGGDTVDNWMHAVHGEGLIECHVISNQQCAGSGIFRTNVCKVPRNDELLTLPRDTRLVFATTQEFVDHHAKE